jgi:hypothetical protein
MSHLTDDERTNALGLFNTARSYWRSAEHLNAAELKVTHPHAPVTFLYCHALELYLKAYLRAAGHSVADLKKVGHRVARLTDAAKAAGLKLDPESTEILSHMDNADVAIEARYIVTGFARQPSNEALASVAEQLDQVIAPLLKSKGHAVREEQFERPTAPPDDSLEDKTTTVLLHLFESDDDEEQRDVGAMAAILQMPRSVLKYHLDQLEAARLADCVDVNSITEQVIWALTPAGRQYVMRRLIG